MARRGLLCRLGISLRTLCPAQPHPYHRDQHAIRSMASSSGPGILEMRTYVIKPDGLSDYLQMCQDSAGTRLSANPGFLGMFATETGGQLNVLRHFYKFKDMDHRQAVRARMGQDLAWRDFLATSKPHIASQESLIYVPCNDVMEAAGSSLLSDLQPQLPQGADTPGAVYELRRYQLVPGYPTVPSLREMFVKGLPDKIAADEHGKLVAFAASDVGVLNNVIELWRYNSMEASLKARQASRKAAKWRECISGAATLTQTFTTELMNPVPLSPWQ